MRMTPQSKLIRLPKHNTRTEYKPASNHILSQPGAFPWSLVTFDIKKISTLFVNFHSLNEKAGLLRNYHLPSTHQLTKTRCDGTWFTELWLVIDCQLDNRWRQPYRSVRATAPKCAIPTSRWAGRSDHIHIRTAALITFSGPSRRGCGLKYVFGKRSRVTVYVRRRADCPARPHGGSGQESPDRRALHSAHLNFDDASPRSTAWVPLALPFPS